MAVGACMHPTKCIVISKRMSGANIAATRDMAADAFIIPRRYMFMVQGTANASAAA